MNKIKFTSWPINSKDSKPFGIKFHYPWRPEQRRVLDNIIDYLDDQRIHIVAAPGAGKTNLGLEIFNRLQMKTLIVSPTRLIRNQWIDRLSDFQLSHASDSWCTKSLIDTSLLTSTTYQGLFSLDKKIKQIYEEIEPIKDEDRETQQFNCISEWFHQHQIKLLILDEAHHLKSEWWKVLMKFVSTSKDLIIISLTATPPYDASSVEWSRYQKLCGIVDEQISIPELVRSNSLCPHQDYIWLVNADIDLQKSLKKYRQNLSHFIDELSQNLELHYLLSLHHWLDENLELNTRQLLENLDECLALLSLFKLQEKELPLRILELLELQSDSIPNPDVHAWEILLSSFIKGDFYPIASPLEEYRKVFKSMLSTKRYLRNQTVSLDNTKQKIESFNKSKSRVKACFDITLVESKIRKKWMRLVILSDYIRDEKFKLSIKDTDVQTGAYPLFHYFIHHLPVELASKTVLLTGRLCIVAKSLLTKIADELEASTVLEYEDYSEHHDFCCLNTNNHQLTKALTYLHQQGFVMILIGTRSLLGEGWDAPHVNALIMATQTGAFVTTNQIRGRAIRVDKNDDLKTSSIWHIISSTNDTYCNKYIFQDLNKRFKTFAGLHANKLSIESGIERLALLDQSNKSIQSSPEKLTKIEYSNQIMCQRLENDVFNLKARWQNALEKSLEHKLVSGINFQTNVKTSNTLTRYTAKINARLIRRSKTLKYLALASIGLSPLLYPFVSTLPLAMASMFSVTGLTLGKLFLDSKPQYFASYYSKKFAEIILTVLIKLGRIKNNLEFQKQVSMETLSDGYFRFFLINATHKENQLFLEALSQLLEPGKMVRYLILINKTPKQGDVFAVPHVFGVNQKTAKVFHATWAQTLPEFGYCHLLSTANEQGRTLLLKLQANQLLSKQEASESISLVEKWQ
jgi:superfamily II DNA or RNA helicase